MIWNVPEPFGSGYTRPMLFGIILWEGSNI